MPQRMQVRPDMTSQEKDDYVLDFNKRYPSLSGIEMVETEIEPGNGAGGTGSVIERNGLKGREV